MGIYLVIKLFHYSRRVRIRIENDLRRVVALLVKLVADLHNLEGVVLIYIAVRYVKVKKIYIGVRKKLHMLSDDPAVACVIISVKRLGKPMHSANIAVYPLARFGIDSVRILCKIAVGVHDLLQIVDSVVAVLTVPEKVEKTDVTLAV